MVFLSGIEYEASLQNYVFVFFSYSIILKLLFFSVFFLAISTYMIE